MTAETFIGVDLAWKTDGNHSGIAVLVGDKRQAQLSALAEDLLSMEGVVHFIASHAAANTVVAVDASLVVRNQTGQRPCETLISKQFGRFHASCHTSNLTKVHTDAGMRLVRELTKLGFVHDFDINTAKQRGGHWLFEVYPHPAMVRLFGLDRIIAYKKGPVAQKRLGLGILRRHVAALVSGSVGLVVTPILDELLARDLEALRGDALKRYEDTLDALFCSYLAWHCWRWGQERNEMFGTLEEGYIVVPKAHSQTIGSELVESSRPLGKP
jgi:predicted RNase H-like nuclease